MTEAWRRNRPAPDEYAPFYESYIARVPDGDVVRLLGSQIDETIAFLRAIPESKGDHRYADGKWSIRETIGHMIDAERVFAYRALRFSRGDEIPVEGFDENLYVAAATFGRRSLGHLIAEFEFVRRSTIAMLEPLDETEMTRVGVANGKPVSVRALAFITAGHELHHVAILKDRYLR